MTKRFIVPLPIQIIAATIILSSLVGCAKRDSVESSIPPELIKTALEKELKDKSIDSLDKPQPPELSDEAAMQADLFKKVVVKTNDVVVYKDPENLEKADKKVKYFDIFYEFGRIEANGKKYVRVSKSTKYDDLLGFVAEEDVVDWSSRVGFVPPAYSETRSNLIELFASVEDAKARYRGENVKPICEYEAKKDQNVSKTPWLISDKKTFDDKVAYKVYGLGKLDADVKAYNDAEIQKLQEAVRRLDVTFLIDGTSSMSEPIAEVKEGVELIANTLESLKAEEGVDVQFGLVVYRDVYLDKAKTQRDKKMYEFNNLGDLKEFVDKLGKVKAIGGGDINERGYVAIQDAIKQTSWRESSVRSLIVVGDAQWHEDGESNPTKIGNDEIADLAEENRVSIDVIAVRSDRLANQLSSLTSRTGGKTRLFNEVDKDKLAQEISQKLGARAKEVKFNGDVLDSLAEGDDINTISKETGKSHDEIVNVFRVLRTQGVELERFKNILESGEAVLVQGWIVVDKSASLEVFLRGFEADSVKSMLGALRASDGSVLDRYQKAVGIAFDTRVQEAKNESEPAANPRFAYENSGLPFGEESVLRYTNDDIGKMSDDKRSELFDKIERKLDEFEEYRNDDSRWNQTTIQDAGWIPEKAFP